MLAGRRALVLGLLALACDLKTGEQRETRAPGRRNPRSKRRRKHGPLDEDPAVVQAVAELEREPALHLRLTGTSESPADRSPAALRDAVLRSGGGRITPERVHLAPGEATDVQFEFFVPADPAAPVPLDQPAPPTATLPPAGPAPP
jgi:hypothetical protein